MQISSNIVNGLKSNN